MAVDTGVIQREAERGQRLAPARRHVQREEAGRHAGFAAHMGEDAAAQLVDRQGLARRRRHLSVERFEETRQAGLKRQPIAILPPLSDTLVEALRRLEIRVHE